MRSSRRKIHETTTTATNDAATMPNWLTKLSETSSKWMPDVVPNPNSEMSAATTPNVATTVTRDQPSLSFTAEITTSRIEIIEVNPAKSSDAKKSTPMIGPRPPGAWEMISGKATKASPIPEVTTSSMLTPAACAMKPSAENTPMPARISKPEVEKHTTKPEPVILERILS